MKIKCQLLVGLEWIELIFKHKLKANRLDLTNVEQIESIGIKSMSFGTTHVDTATENGKNTLKKPKNNPISSNHICVKDYMSKIGL